MNEIKGKVGIVILNYNTPNDVITCVDSINEKTQVDKTIYIVDNNSTDNSKEVLTENYSDKEGIVLILHNENKGFSAGNNVGIKRALEDGCEYICVCNADILLENDALYLIREFMEKNKEVGVAASSINLPDTDCEGQVARLKLILSNYIVEKSFLGKIKHFTKKYPRYLSENQRFDSDFIFYGMPSGCFYLARNEFFLKTGLLDEDVFLFNEEDIMAHKAEKIGMKTAIVSDAWIFHNHHSSVKKTSSAIVSMSLKVSPLLVLRKYAHISRFTLWCLSLVLKLHWALKSLSNKDYRSKKKLLRQKLKYIASIKRNSEKGEVL